MTTKVTSGVTRASSLTFQIPSDFATLQEAVDALSPTFSTDIITLNIESGHQPDTGIVVANGDYSNFRITSTDAEVTLSPTFSLTGYFVRGTNARLPRLECLVDANGRASHGYSVYYGSHGYVAPNCGIKNVWGTGLLAYGASVVHAEDTVWTGCAVNAIGTLVAASGAGITSWGSLIYAGRSDVSDSHYYGAQAAHGGILNFDHGNADRCFRYGIRGSDGGYISADGATANDCGVEGDPLGTGYGFYAFNNSFIAARDGRATNCVSRGVVAAGGSIIHCVDGVFSGAGETGCFAINGSTIDAVGATITDCKTYGIWATSASSIDAGQATITGCGTIGNDAAAFCESVSRISVHGADLSNCAGIAVLVETASVVHVGDATLTNAGKRAVFCSGASMIHAGNVDASGAAQEGIRVAGGSTANIQVSNFQCGASPAATDIIVENGSFINAAGATGGLSQTKNTLTSEGVIFQ